MFSWIGDAFTFMSSASIHGVSLTAIVVVLLVLSALGFIIRGNK